MNFSRKSLAVLSAFAFLGTASLPLTAFAKHDCKCEHKDGEKKKCTCNEHDCKDGSCKHKADAATHSKGDEGAESTH